MRKRDKPALRNLAAAANPLLRKGGVHRKSHKAARRQAREDLRRDTRRGSDLHAKRTSRILNLPCAALASVHPLWRSLRRISVTNT